MGRGLSFQYGTAHILNYLVFTHNAYRYHKERMSLSSGVRQTDIGVMEFSRFGSNLVTLWESSQQNFVTQPYLWLNGIHATFPIWKRFRNFCRCLRTMHRDTPC